MNYVKGLFFAVFVLIFGIAQGVDAVQTTLPPPPGLDPSVCDLQNDTIIPPPLPELAKSFSTIIEWKIVDSNKTVSIHDYDSQILKTSSITVIQEGVSTQLIFYNVLQQYVTIKQDLSGKYKCKTDDISLTQSFIGVSDIWFATTRNLYDLIRSSHVKYVGPAVIRSINVKHWTTCMFLYESNMTVTMDMYFANNGWALPLAPPDARVPVRLEIKGTQNLVKQLHFIGDYMDFKPTPDYDITNLQPPPGVYCPDRFPDRLVVKNIPLRFTVVMEAVNEDFKTISYSTIYYDAVAKFIRYDSKKSSGTDPGTDPDPTTKIYDFSTGVVYTVDQYLGSCGAELLTKRSEFVEDNPNTSQLDIQMVPSTDIFYLTNAITQYIGKRLARGIYCNVWTGLYYDPTVNVNLTVEWYFEEQDWTESIGLSVSSNSLIQIKVWGGSQHPTIYNIMKFEPSAPPMSSFDLSSCYKSINKTHFIINFQVFGQGSLTDVSRFYMKELIHEDMAKSALLEPSRLTNIVLEYFDDRTFFFAGTLLDRALKKNKYIVPPVIQHELSAAFDFLTGLIDGMWMKSIPKRAGGGNITVQANRIVPISYMNVLSTTTTSTLSTSTFVVPTLPHAGPKTSGSTTPTPAPPMSGSTTAKPTAKPDPKPTPKPTPQPTPKPTPMPQTASTTPCVCPKSTPCPTVTTASSFAPVKCPPTQKPTTSRLSTPCPKVITLAPMKCPKLSTPALMPTHTATPSLPQLTTSQKQVVNNPQPQQQSHSGVSGGGAAGIAIAMLLVGVAIGFVVTRIYHIRKNPNKLLNNTELEY